MVNEKLNDEKWNEDFYDEKWNDLKEGKITTQEWYDLCGELLIKRMIEFKQTNLKKA